MKIHHFLSIFILAFLIGCGSPAKKQTPKVAEKIPGYLGEAIRIENALTGSQVKSMLSETDSVWVSMKSTIVANCQSSGCWMDLDLGDGEVIKVTFKDGNFTIPVDSEGKTVFVEGFATKEFIPVAMLKHYAEDDGKSQEEIDAITEPEAAYTFEAIGVIIKG